MHELFSPRFQLMDNNVHFSIVELYVGFLYFQLEGQS